MIRFNYKYLRCSLMLALMCLAGMSSARADETANAPNAAEEDARDKYLLQARQRIQELTNEKQRNTEQLQQLERKLLEATRRIEIQKKQWQIAAKELQQRARDEANVKAVDGELRVFRLRYLSAAVASDSINDIFPDATRISVDDRSNSLIVLGEPAKLSKIEALLMQLDGLPQREKPAPATPADAEDANRSMLIKLFWLADGLAAGEGKDPTEALPESVLRAVNKLGVVEPRLVAQAVNSFVVRGREDGPFSSTLPVQLLQQEVVLKSRGSVLLSDEVATLRINIDVQGNGIKSDLGGSLTMPVGHFMVLGTSSSMIPETVPVPEAPAGAESGIGIMGKRTGYAQQFKTSRFAFVVQVVDAESFAPEEK